LLERVARALDVPIEALISRRISVDPEVQRMAALIENAAPDVRAQVMALLAAPKPAAALRRGRICLLGPYGPEKTRVATMLGEALGLPVVELSAGIERETGMPLAEVRSLYGPDGFRRLEAEALEHAIAQTAPVLLTVSDGLAAQAAPYARLLERFHTVWLHTTPRDQMQTSAAQDAHARLLARVHAQVDVSGLTSQQCVDALFALCSTSGFSGKFP
jgi:XRE family aerobic/anaerobic benzoate catabolism transcriptional regulator